MSVLYVLFSLLVLDEVDQLSQDILYSLFELPSVTGSCLLLIGKFFVCIYHVQYISSGHYF